MSALKAEKIILNLKRCLWAPFFVFKNSMCKVQKVYACEVFFVKKCLTKMYKRAILLSDNDIINSNYIVYGSFLF